MLSNTIIQPQAAVDDALVVTPGEGLHGPQIMSTAKQVVALVALAANGDPSSVNAVLFTALTHTLASVDMREGHSFEGLVDESLAKFRADVLELYAKVQPRKAELRAQLEAAEAVAEIARAVVG